MPGPQKLLDMPAFLHALDHSHQGLIDHRRRPARLPNHGIPFQLCAHVMISFCFPLFDGRDDIATKRRIKPGHRAAGNAYVPIIKRHTLRK